jgi:hypothetical protein
MGGTNKQTATCLGRFEARSGKIRILARDDELAAASGMGMSLALARGSVVAAGKTIWLWLRHIDSSVLFNIRLRDLPDEGEIKLPRPATPRSQDGTLNMTREELRMAPGPGDSALLLDTWTAALWKLDLTGAADVVTSLIGLPRQLGVPGENLQGDIVLFAAPSDPIEPRVEARVIGVDIEARYPALLILRDGRFSAISQDDIFASATFPIFAMQLDQTLYEPGRDTWIGYDAASGQIVRMRLGPKHRR